MILVRRGIAQYSVPVPQLRQIKGTTICIYIGGKPVKLVAVYQSSLRSLVDADLSEYIGGRKQVLLAGDLNAKLKDWNSILNSARRRVLLREFASRVTASSIDQMSLPLFVAAQLYLMFLK